MFSETGDDDVEFKEEVERVPHITHVNNILHSFFSNAELYLTNHQMYNSNGFYAHKSHITNNFKSTLTDFKGILHCEVYDWEEYPEKLLEGSFFRRRMKLYSRPKGFMLYGKLGIDFLTTSELLYPNMKVRIRLIRARPNFYMITENPNVSLGIVDCCMYNRRVISKKTLTKTECLNWLMVQLSTTTWKHWQRLISFLHVRTNSFKKIYSTMQPIGRIAVAMNSISAFPGSFGENPFWYQQFNLRDNRLHRGGHPIVHHYTTDKCRLYVTTMKAMNFQDDIHQFQLIISKTNTY